MPLQPKKYLTPEEYLEIDRKADCKSEYFNGEMFAMGGASARHVLIVTNVVSELRSQLKTSPCTVYSTDLRVRVSPAGLYTYPDVVVVFNTPSFIDYRNDTLTNPLLIVEVLSEATKNYDRGEKFEQYRGIDSFKEYVLLAQDKYRLEHYVRQADGTWLFSETKRIEDTVKLASIGCSLKLGEVYDKLNM
ncbi:MAG: Uma2 family endonuclease [Desulfobacteraceae bacterium]|nr:MAG: Uma2 family endonuclease [Desulfobacteraceae bacterium]